MNDVDAMLMNEWDADIIVSQHYARLVHAANVDGHGYAFPYDDVTPDGGVGQEGAMSSPNPELLTVTVGGSGAFLA